MNIIDGFETANRMKAACERFLESLTPALLKSVLFDFDSKERQRWHYVPREMFDRKGVPLKEMTEKQRRAAFGLIESGLSKTGFEKAKAIIDLETILDEIEKSRGWGGLSRDPELYYISIFGDPTSSSPWSWRAEGHHLSLHFTIVKQNHVSNYPFFFGANPAQVHHGPKRGLRILSSEEELARTLLTSFSGRQKQKSIIHPVAPADILTRAAPKVSFDTVEGLAMDSMEIEQRELLVDLVHVYVDRLPDDLAKIEMNNLKRSGFKDIHFAWAGGQKQGEKHYYRLHGPTLFIEYDNTQDNANHIHTVWRHLEDDFGMDLLNLHYKNGHNSSKS